MPGIWKQRSSSPSVIKENLFPLCFYRIRKRGGEELPRGRFCWEHLRRPNLAGQRREPSLLPPCPVVRHAWPCRRARSAVRFEWWVGCSVTAGGSRRGAPLSVSSLGRSPMWETKKHWWQKTEKSLEFVMLRSCYVANMSVLLGTLLFGGHLKKHNSGL